MHLNGNIQIQQIIYPELLWIYHHRKSISLEGKIHRVLPDHAGISAATIVLPDKTARKHLIHTGTVNLTRDLAGVVIAECGGCITVCRNKQK